MNKLIIFLSIILLLPLVTAIDRVAMVDMVTDDIVSLEYDPGLMQAYHDDVGRHDIKVRAYSGTNLEDKWLCLVYKVGDTFIEITEGPASETRCEQLIGVNSFYETPDSIKIDDTRGKYPAILYAAISDDKTIELSDAFIKLNPETDGWLIGADGGTPCMGSKGAWAYIPEECNIETSADPIYDSYDITLKPYKNQIGITVDAAYYPTSDMSAAEIPASTIKVVVGIGTSLENIFDSTTAVLDNEVKLNYGTYTGNLNVYVNGIKEGELSIDATGSPSVDAGAGSGDKKTEIWGTDKKESKLKWIFPINYVDSVIEVTVYIKKPVASATLVLNKLDAERLEGKVYDYLSPSSSFDRDNVASVYVKFKIPKQWPHNNFLLHDMIFLNFLNKDWKSATTYLLEEDLENYYFISWMDNLYDFSIGEKTGDIVPLPEEELAKIAEEIKESLEQEPKKLAQANYIWLILLIIFILIIILSRKKKRKK